MRRNRLARRLASRFVAGEQPDDAVTAVRELNRAGITASVDMLGESVSQADEARHARDVYLDTLDRIHKAGVDSNVSVKLTQMGLDISEKLAIENLCSILARAKQYDSFVRIDMESSAYTERTLQLFKREFFPQFGNTVGVVLQSYLRRTEQDVEDMIALGARVRLCKGAYKEPADVAFPQKKDVDANYVECMERLLERGHYPGLATHDEKIIAHAHEFTKARQISTDRYEFQMLYGVRRDLQYGLREDGYRMRVYVPFGTHWYPYLMRRLAERPANIVFLTASLLRESVRRRPSRLRR